MRFLDKRTNEIKNAYSVEYGDGKVHIQFEKNGKIYSYKGDNIELINDDSENNKKQLVVYSYVRTCYKCKGDTEILTYIVWDNADNENLLYPWDKNRLNEEWSSERTLAHIKYPEIEFYPIKVIGADEELDELMMKNYPSRIYKKYSNTQSREYPMNVCQHCGAKQGEFFVYSEINKRIQQMEELEIVGEVEY